MSGKRYLCVKNFDEQQHYKDRNPIWIKLSCSLLDDYRFANIGDDAKFHAVGLMLLASRLDNKFPDDEAWLRRKINAEKEINIELLLEIGFLDVVKEKIKREKKPTMTRKSMKTQGDRASTTFEAAENCASTEQNRTDENKTEEKRTQHNRTDETREPKPDAGGDVVAADVVVCDFQNSSESAKTSRRQIATNGEDNPERNASGADADNRTIEANSAANINQKIEAGGDENINRTIEAGGAANIDGQTNAVAEISVDAAVKKGMAAGGNLSAFTLEECLRYVERCQLDGQEIKNPRGLATTIFQTGASDAFIRATLYPQKQADIDRKAFGAPVWFTDEPCRVCYGARMADRDGKGFRKCEHCRDERGKATGFEPRAPPDT